ncbi:nicotinate-nucleotide--dimethylbenzimidazole phosphoribosyltransferase [Hydrogenophaga sp.]|jgi:nicotinate-nucleotide--dimethylbenzimidazole phosphoribosyltransferase|uniref:nicotinate-nucleotide--dimethylbenzimidazole phosphoribosyltransferase n=1 Tax=Hydrogenophaga sp. TaxID=1904254 RepID=UPI00262B4113|nr:nicotinate-nucleotide--dimethylbenzimidazole phosphoribosyltransferase [Hydrogenophaga sp.]MDM7949165.1 nicotinate-nucleotide--dimethylbenzimidazole phosphoribosyltransferase [Hydrogenophaga sp.]
MLIRHHPAETVAPTEGGATALKLPAIEATTDTVLDAALNSRIQPEGYSQHVLGRLEDLVRQLARVQSAGPLPLDQLVFDSPQVLVFAADHGIADEGVSAVPQEATRERVQQILQGRAPINTLAKTMGFELTVVDAGVASHVVETGAAASTVPLLVRKIGYGTRNMVLGPAMSLAQAISALQAGMDVVRHLPGNVLALGDVGVGNTSCAALLLSRLCGVPLADACGRDHPIPGGLDSTQLQNKLEKLFAAASRHRKAVKPLDALAALGGFEIAMMAGAMLQAASERRVVLVDGFVAGAAALVARGLSPAVADYLVFAHRAIDPGHRLMLIHLQVQPLMDLELSVGQGVGALMAWPMLQTAQALLKP